MKFNVVLDDGARMPQKAYGTDAGFDLFSPVDRQIAAFDTVTIDTGVHIEIPEGWCGLIVSKSGLNVKQGMQCTGLIDAGYTGSITVKLYRADADNRYKIKSGDKIAQIIFLPVPKVKLVEVSALGDSERGSDGFGSTGR